MWHQHYLGQHTLSLTLLNNFTNCLSCIIQVSRHLLYCHLQCCLHYAELNYHSNSLFIQFRLHYLSQDPGTYVIQQIGEMYCTTSHTNIYLSLKLIIAMEDLCWNFSNLLGFFSRFKSLKHNVLNKGYVGETPHQLITQITRFWISGGSQVFIFRAKGTQCRWSIG